MALVVKRNGQVCAVIEMMPERLPNGTLQKTAKGHTAYSQGLGVQVVQDTGTVKKPDQTPTRPKELEMMDRALRDYTGYTRPGTPPSDVDNKGEVIFINPKINKEDLEEQCHVAQIGNDLTEGGAIVQVRLLTTGGTIPQGDGNYYVEIVTKTITGVKVQNFKITSVKNRGSKSSKLGTVAYYDLTIDGQLPRSLNKGSPVSIKQMTTPPPPPPPPPGGS